MSQITSMYNYDFFKISTFSKMSFIKEDLKVTPKSSVFTLELNSNLYLNEDSTHQNSKKT